MRYCSTYEAADRTGVTYRQLDYWVRRRYVTPATAASSGEHRPGKSNARRWSLTDLAAAGTVAALISQDSDRTVELARLAAQAVYRWHGRVPFAVVALPDIVEPAIDATDVAGIVEKLTVATVIGLEP